VSSTHEFQPVAVESHGSLSDTTASFLEELGRKITDHSGEPVAQFLFQRVSMLVQIFTSILLRETFPDNNDKDTLPFQPDFMFLTFLLLTPGILTSGVFKNNNNNNNNVFITITDTTLQSTDNSTITNHNINIT